MPITRSMLYKLMSQMEKKMLILAMILKKVKTRLVEQNYASKKNYKSGNFLNALVLTTITKSQLLSS